MEQTGRPRKKLKITLLVLGSIFVLFGLLVGTMLVLRPYWELRGNFFPTFDFENREAHDKRLEEHRAAQRVADGAQSDSELARALWPGYMGPNRDGKSTEQGLLQSWPEQGPPEVYRQPIGRGYAGFAIGGGRAYTIEQRRENEAVVCYDFATGAEIWTFEYAANFIEQMGGDGPRSTPALDSGRLYSLGALGQLYCLNVATGEPVWSVDILADEPNLTWGTASSPLIVDEKVLVTSSGLGGPSVWALDRETGEVIYRTVEKQQGYTSLIETRLAGRRQLLNLAGFDLNGLDAETGELLWSFPWHVTNGINCAQPIAVGEDRVFVSSGYGKGAALIKIESAARGEGPGTVFGVTELWSNRNMKTKFNPAVEHEGYIYGLDEGILACIEVQSGKRQWKGGRYGHGQILYADGNLIVQSEMGRLALVRAQPEKFEEVSAFEALTGKSWNVPALAAGRLLLRNGKEMVCYDLRADQGL